MNASTPPPPPATAGHPDARPAAGRARPGRWRPAAALGIAALVAASGCSVATKDSSSSGTGRPGATTAGGAPADRNVASPGTWDCAGGTCDWKGNAGRAESGAAADKAVTAGGGGALPMTGSGAAPTSTMAGAAPGSPGERSAAMTAGSVDDNAQWDDYLRYRQDYDARHPAGSYQKVAVEGRDVLTVVDGAGQPILGATITVTDGAGAPVATLLTYADGRALFHPPSSAADPRTQQRPTYKATATKGGVSASATITAEQREYRLELAGAPAATPPKLDVLFLIDTTGSMGDEIDRLKANMTAVAEQVAKLGGGVDARFAMTVYRDRGDLFVTRTFDFTGDAATFTKALADVQADGGGDTPEDLNAGFHDALTKPSWRGEDTVKLVFLIADASPHLDYDGPRYADDVIAAAGKGVKVFPIASSGADDPAEYVFRQLAQITMGRFVFLTYGADGRSPGDSTPMHVDKDAYSVLSLDQLVVKLVTDEVGKLRR